MKIKPTKICTHEELATVFTVEYSYPRKLITSKFSPRNTVITMICTFTVVIQIADHHGVLKTVKMHLTVHKFS